ncbi:sensor histidine kinase [Qipengyuania sp.]|uniref:sensor histidine kinase n=1 Tax=Qipengyuania sp. TaxID=2004515 RepID=UPI0035C7AB6C
MRQRGSALWINTILVSLAGLGMFAALLMAIRTVNAEREEREHFQRTADTISALAVVGRAALNGETGQRGYLLTLDRRYLVPYQAGRDTLPQALDNLRRLVEDGGRAEEIALVDEVEVLARAKFAEMEQSVALVKRGELLEAQRLVLTDEGQEAMARLREAIRRMEQIELAELRAASSETADAEARVLPILVGLMLLLLIAMIAGARLVARGARAEAEAAQAAEIAKARDRADLLAKELNHRVKNLFAVVLAIVKLSSRDAPEAKPVTESIAQRIQALLKAHEVSQGELDRPMASLRSLVETSLAPYRSDELSAELEGEEVDLPAQCITPLGLVLHEMTTNAVKYGGWSRSGGTIAVNWEIANGDLCLTWREAGAPVTERPRRQGFGSQLMTSAARQLGGTIDREFAEAGALITIRFPLPD